MSLQEKFQITIPGKDEDGEGWADAKSVRKTGEAGFAHQNNATADAECSAKFNLMPPGMDISGTMRKRINNMPLVVSGESDMSKDTNPEAFAKGFTRRHLDGCDDQYTGEHVDLFYGEAEDANGNCGFVERNNYLDRM